jgi:hypothetical protein
MIARVDLGSGGFLIDGPQGRFALQGREEELKRFVGRKVELEGEEVGNFGFLMSGDRTLEVRSIRGV